MITTLTEYLHAAKSIRTTGALVWYRGIDYGSHSVAPGFYWRGLEQEYSNVADFITLAPQYMERSGIPEGDTLDVLWQWYFMMQHYGMPTRLLDWTENPLVALYFAVFKAARSPGDREPCVWAIDPSVLNSATIGDRHIIVPGGAFSRYWLPQLGGTDRERCDIGRPQTFDHDDGKRYSNENPIAISPPRQNRRIIAQAGVFTIHGARGRGLETIVPISSDPRGIENGLVRLDIEREAAAELLEDLLYLGINELALFPELPNLAKHITQSDVAPATDADSGDAGRGGIGDSGSAATSGHDVLKKRAVKKKAIKKRAVKRKAVRKKKARRER